MKNIKKVFSISVILPVILLLSACNPIEDDTRSSSMLIVEKVQGQDYEGNTVDFLQSDVIKNSTVYADSATATIRAATLDPDPLLGTSQYNDIVLTRYTVSYSRTDGKNSPGVDVPLPFEGSLSAIVKVGSSTTISFVVVREVAKLEPPLVALAEGRAEGVLQVTARIDFYGRDLTNRNVKATGYLTIYFANYVDE
ncbi:MAG: hypothetical protein FJY81_00695 [Candidatus Aminicenantes bacterium]|nr:hypothetical protein [Candidatus Aminicenantes bacterium]